jgi:hypothetical protein
MSTTYDFKIAGSSFRLNGLKLRDALAAEAIIVQVFFPVGAAFAGGVNADALRTALTGIGAPVQTLVDLFAPTCEVDWQGKWVPLSSFLELVFERKTTKLLAWLLHCIQWQYADFFDGTGLPLLTVAASQFTSLIGLTGASGGSQPAIK